MALVAPSSRYDRDALAVGIEVLERWKLVVEAPPLTDSHRYLAATDEVRAAQLTEAFERDDIAAVIGVRGGFGTARLLDLFDTAVVAAHPKMFVGYSDITLLLSRIVAEAGVVAFHGPMASTDLPRLAKPKLERYRRFLFGEDDWWAGRELSCLVSGAASGRLAGGCLSVVVTSLGTPYEIDTRGAVLFLEDIGEPSYRIDRMLTHLSHAGKLDDLAAVALGNFHGCEPADEVFPIFEEVFAPRGIPVVTGFDGGHHSGGAVVPMGCEVRVDADEGIVELLEPALLDGVAVGAQAVQ